MSSAVLLLVAGVLKNKNKERSGSRNEEASQMRGAKKHLSDLKQESSCL